MTDKYMEQYERMKRSYDRFHKIKHGLEHTEPSVHYEDDIYVFFMHCWHLKEWIKNDSAVKTRMPKIGDDVERFVKESEPLSLSADLCNSLKHLERNTQKYKPRSSEEPTFGRKVHHYEQVFGSASIHGLDWLVERKNKPPIDAFDLATDCISEWDKFMLGKGLK
jgi:hypothetical protein